MNDPDILELMGREEVTMLRRYTAAVASELARQAHVQYSPADRLYVWEVNGVSEWRKLQVTTPTVILIGGAPGAGKTTLARALATTLGADLMTADDLFIAAKTFTTPQSHPGLHVMNVPNFIDYFTNSTVDKLTTDAVEQHKAIWPAIERVIRYRLSGHRPIVIDGWFFRPKQISELNLANVRSFWLVADSPVLEKREREHGSFGRSSDPERMLQNFLGRSYWHNDLIRQQASELGMPILHQDGGASVDDLCDLIVAQLHG